MALVVTEGKRDERRRKGRTEGAERRRRNPGELFGHSKKSTLTQNTWKSSSGLWF